MFEVKIRSCIGHRRVEGGVASHWLIVANPRRPSADGSQWCVADQSSIQDIEPSDLDQMALVVILVKPLDHHGLTRAGRMHEASLA